MSLYRVSIIARNPKDEERLTLPLEAVVDSGSELTWLPAGALRAAGIEARRRQVFITATGARVTREVGYAILAAEGFETIDEVVFGEPDDLILLGVRTIEGFSVTVDFIGHRMVARAAFAA